MQIVAAMLCDYASVREGLLTVVSGGMRPGRVPRYGLYAVELVIDGVAHQTLPFRVAPPSARLPG